MKSVKLTEIEQSLFAALHEDLVEALNRHASPAYISMSVLFELAAQAFLKSRLSEDDFFNALKFSIEKVKEGNNKNDGQ